MSESFHWVLIDGFLSVIAGIGAMFGVVLAVYVLYRVVSGFGAIIAFFIRTMFGGVPVDGVPHYQDEDYP